MLDTIVVSKLLGGENDADHISLVELRAAPGSGPGPHLDPWRESFYVLEGELTFRVDERGMARTIVARPGDAVSIPQGIGHAFTVTSPDPARFLIISNPGDIAAFFADAGQPIAGAVIPGGPPHTDRVRLQAAFTRHGLRPFRFSEGG
jgi:quercetin dioxygenase-like cupin family protein